MDHLQFLTVTVCNGKGLHDRCPEMKAEEGEWLIQGQAAYHQRGCVQKPRQLDCRSASKHMLWPFPSSLNRFLGTLVLPEVIKVSETVRRVTPGSAFTSTFHNEVRVGLHRAKSMSYRYAQVISDYCWKWWAQAWCCSSKRSPAAQGPELALPNGTGWRFMVAAAQVGARFGVSTVSPLNSVGRPFVFLGLSEI